MNDDIRIPIPVAFVAVVALIAAIAAAIGAQIPELQRYLKIRSMD